MNHSHMGGRDERGYSMSVCVCVCLYVCVCMHTYRHTYIYIYIYIYMYFYTCVCTLVSSLLLLSSCAYFFTNATTSTAAATITTTHLTFSFSIMEFISSMAQSAMATPSRQSIKSGLLLCFSRRSTFTSSPSSRAFISSCIPSLGCSRSFESRVQEVHL